MCSPLAVTVTDVGLTLWLLQGIPCMILGYLTARKTGRSAFNWILIGFVAWFPPMVGLAIMVAAYLYMPPPSPRRPGSPPPPGAAPRRT